MMNQCGRLTLRRARLSSLSKVHCSRRLSKVFLCSDAVEESKDPIRCKSKTRTALIIKMEEEERAFPAGLTPSELIRLAQVDKTKLVWDLTAASPPTDELAQDENGQAKNCHVKIYLKQEEEEVADTSKTSATSKLEKTQPTSDHEEEVIESSVLQYQRQLRKTQAAKRAGAVLSEDQLQTVYQDDAIVVVNKPAGVLCVPGIRNNDSVANLLFNRLQQEELPDKCQDACSMAVHRLDMDTSGLVVFGKTKSAVSTLHQIFRRESPQDNKKKNKKKNKRQHDQINADSNNTMPAVVKEYQQNQNTPIVVMKEYEALVCGHLPAGITSGYIDLPLQRDVHHPPFMRVSTPHSETLARQVVDALRERNWTKLSKRNPKPSRTCFQVVARELLGELPVTRLSLTLITGRTHQLRVHCAAMGFPIVGDPVYGIFGESAFCGGLFYNPVEIIVTDAWEPRTWRAPIALQKQLMEQHPPGVKDMCLHAKKLGFSHPTTGETMIWEVPPLF